MKIRDVRARWIRCPIPEAQQHVSDFGRITSFDAAIVSVELDDGSIGWGEAKAGVGSSGPCRAVVETIRDEYAPALIGLSARRITAIWDRCTTAPGRATRSNTGGGSLSWVGEVFR